MYHSTFLKLLHVSLTKNKALAFYLNLIKDLVGYLKKNKSILMEVPSRVNLK